ncbi:hypothetical protein PYW08_013184 [Mythimna loreyi]|uniref:Uncharacterized protein n=1 Tax=Mythimna loreyi TaxID=667449 RepID=A0ACC2QEV2_9NEOP|nr:hypothetical protein PYW08_013184 [Mythimna loreyi]
MDPQTNLITMLKDLRDSIEKGDEAKLKDGIYLFRKDLKSNKEALYELYSNGNQCASQTALIIAACRGNKADILSYLLYEANILEHFPGDDFNNTEVRTQRTEAIKLALIRDAFPIVEKLYDYWIGNLHWDGHDINKITKLGEILQDVYKRLYDEVVKNQQLLIDIHSLIKFNAFQKKLYSSISNMLLSSDKTAEMLVKVLVVVVSIYDEYSDEDKVRIPHEHAIQEQELQASLADKTSVYSRMHIYVLYSVYFRKLDFNVALLILDNWHNLRRQFRDRFNQPEEYFTNNLSVKSCYERAASSYKEIECSIFHFIYRTWDDWRLYLPRNRQLTVEEHTGIYQGYIKRNLITKYDKHVLDNGPVLFLERKNFNDHINHLKLLLEEHILSENPAKDYVQKPEKIHMFIDDNYLTPLTSTDTNTYMRDFYSLSKIVYYIEAIENTNYDDVSMIERVLQVTGEMLKSTEKSSHLSVSAKSFLQITIPEDTVKHLSSIRLFLSHADKGQLSTRDDVAKSGKLFNVRQDLIDIKQWITTVLNIYKKKLDKSFLEKGLILLDERIKNLHSHVKPEHIGEIDKYYKIHGRDLMDSKKSIPLIKKLSVDTGITIQLLKEIIWIRLNKRNILNKMESVKTGFATICKEIESTRPMYIKNIRQMLVDIDENNKKVNLINQKLAGCNIKVTMPDNPNDNDIKNIRQMLVYIDENNKKVNLINQKLARCNIKVTMPDNPNDNDINNIRQMLVDIDENNKKVNLINQKLAKCNIKETMPNNPNDNDIKNIRQMLVYIDENNKKVNLINQKLARCDIKETMPDNPNDNDISTLKSTVDKRKRNYKNSNVKYNDILLILNEIKDFSGLWETIRQLWSFCKDQSKNNEPSVTKILEELNKYKSIENLSTSPTFDAIKELDDSYKQKKEPFDKTFLIIRGNELKDMLHEQHIPLEQKEILLKYNNDQKFRFKLEMVLSDIANLLKETGTNMEKSEMLLRGIDLRNVLQHGNPFLDVLADVFDPYDLSSGLVSKAQNLVGNWNSIIQ